MLSYFSILCSFLLLLLLMHHGDSFKINKNVVSITYFRKISPRNHALQMNVFGDAIRFFTNLNKEASASHILIKGTGASEKLKKIKEEIVSSENVMVAFSEIAKKVSECPSATRGGNLGTFKPGMMVREIDKICFEDDLNVVHGPVETQFGSHLVIITRRYEGEKNK